MRIDIKTGKGRIKDNDIKALYLIREAIRLSSPHMIEANFKFHGYCVECWRRVNQLRENK